MSNPPSSPSRRFKANTADADPLTIRTVDTDVTARTAPAIIHEHIQPRLHEIQHKKVLREVHEHHIYHRTLPVLETVILPARHFAESSNGKGLVEISEKDAIHFPGMPPREWMVVPRPSSTTYGQHDGERWPLKDNSRPNDRLLEVQTEPILVDQKTYVTKDGILRTEYLWRHPPVFEDVHGRTVPVQIPAGLSDEWRQAVQQSKHQGVTAERRDRPQRNDGRTRDVKKSDALERGHSPHQSVNSRDTLLGKRMDERVVPAHVMSTGKPQHGALSIRTTARDGDTAQRRVEHPNLARKSSLQNLKGVE